MNLLSIDLGTSGVKVGVFTSSGDLVSFSRRSYAVQRPAPDRVEQDPEAWWAALREATHEALGRVTDRSMASVCVGGQGPVLALVDGDGRPVRPAISWMDGRSEPQRAALCQRLGEEVTTYSLLPKLLWVAEQEAAVLERARWALQSWDFVGFRLAGAGVAAASTFRGDAVWPARWLPALAPEAHRLVPAHVDAGAAYAATRGPWAAELGLPEGIPVVGGVNDGASSMLGAGGAVVGRATDVGGSAGGLAVCWNEAVQVPGVGTWPGVVPGTSMLGGGFAAGGRAVEWWAEVGGLDGVAAALSLAERAPPGSGRLLFLPFLAGERAPLWDSSARAAFLGLTFDHGPEHLARAVLESSAYSLRLLLEAIVSAGVQVDEVRLCGRQAESRLWNQVKADVLNRKVAVPRVTEVALMGNALHAAVGIGAYADAVSAGEAMVHVDHVLEPRSAARGSYEALFATYRAAYEALKPLSAALGHT